MKAKGVTTQMKALDGAVCVITEESLFSCKPKATQMKALNEYILMVLFVLLLKRIHFLVLLLK